MSGSSSTFFWVTSRAAGTTAMVLASLSVGVGLTMGGRLIRRAAPERRTLHEVLALSTLLTIVVHGLSLLGDTWLRPSILDLTVPFHASFQTLPVSLGIIAGWGLFALGLSHYARRRIGLRRWKLIHRFTALAWLLGLVHCFSEGSDAGKAWFIALIIGTGAPGLALLALRYRPSDRSQMSPAGKRALPPAEFTT